MERALIRDALGAYCLENGVVMPSHEHLSACIIPLSDSESRLEAQAGRDFILNGRFIDPWGCDYVYLRYSGASADIVSYGADGRPGGEGDNADVP
jgi:general secretion pathway protein G